MGVVAGDAPEIVPAVPVTEKAVPAAETPITFASPRAMLPDVAATVRLTVATTPWARLFVLAPDRMHVYAPGWGEQAKVFPALAADGPAVI